MTVFSITPGVRSGQSPRFHEMDDFTFQEFCRDLFDAEPSITSCEIYGGPGEFQEGIDLIAHRFDNDGIEVGQCKCYEDFQPKDIRDASDEFFKHWDRWSGENVRRFILFVASDLITTLRQKEILLQKKRFESCGIIYEVWGASKIRNKLRPHPGIVANYLTPAEHWVKEICGQVISSPSPVPNLAEGIPALVNSAIQLQGQFDALVDQLSRQTKENLDRMRDAWREGEKVKVLEWIAALKTDATRWSILTAGVKAQVLRFEAGLKLETIGNIDESKQLADEASILDPSTQNEARVRALIARFEFGPEKGLSYLEGINDIDALNLRLGLLLELNDKIRCQEILNIIKGSFVPNAETYRLSALLSIASKDSDQAQKEIEKALNLAPRWIAVRYTAAITHYFSALSPAAAPDQPVFWPEPVDWAMVQRDENSVKRLRTASRIFKELLDFQATGLDVALLQSWYLASLMIDPDRQEEALEQAHSALLDNSSNYYVISWVLARNLEVDLEPSVKSLEKTFSSPDVTIPHVIALVGICVRKKKIKKARRLLSETRELFVKNKAEGVWIYWNVQTLILQGRIKEAQQIIDKNEVDSDEIRHAQSLVLARRAIASQSGEEFVEYLKKQYEQTDDPVFILQSCDVAFRHQDWEYVVRHSELLIRSFNTADILRLVIISTYNAKRFDQCLTLLDGHRDLFGQGGLPADMRRLRASCLHAQGRLKDAIAEIESLSTEDKSVDGLRQQAQMYLMIGDLKKLSLVGRQLITLPKVDPGEALSLAHVLRQEDFSLAQSLWKKAVSQDLPDRLVGGALSLGYSLGLDKEKEIFGLHRRMQDIARTDMDGAIRLFSLAEFIETQKQFNQQQLDVNAFYQDGRIPVHVLAEKVNIPLTDLYHSHLLENEKQPSYISRHPLFIRHGGKVIGTIENAQQHQLNMDITALLLASHLGILENVEKVFRSIRIPSEVIPSLVEMRDKTLHHQPTRLDNANQIIDLVDKKALKVANPIPVSTEEKNRTLGDPLEVERKSYYEFVQKKDGYILDFLSHLEFYEGYGDASASRVFYAKNIADSLLENGKLTKDIYPAIVQNLGTEGGNSDHLIPPQIGSPIFCFGNVISVLADADILELACSQFDIYIQSEYLDQIKNEVTYFEKTKKQQFDWIGSLVEKLRRGLDVDKYALIPPLLKESDEHTMYGLQAIFSLPNQEHNLIWVDDRFLNGYSNINNIPIVGISEILFVLLARGEIDQAKYFGLLHRMRTDNLCFVSIDAEEIVYFIRKAQIKDRAVVETAELSTLKRNIATTIWRGQILQKPPTKGESPNPQGELEFLFRTASAIADAIERIWSLPEMDIDEKEIYSGWIIDNLFISHLGLSEAIGLQQEVDNEMNLSALGLATLITRSLTMPDDRKNKEDKLQQSYLAWVYEKVLRKSFEANSNIRKRTIDIIKKMLIGIKEENKTFDDAAINIYIQHFCSVLPIQIFDEMKSDDEFTDAIGMRAVVTLGNWELKPDEFWYAAHEAVNERGAEVTPIGFEYKIEFQPHKTKDNITGVLVHDPKTGEQVLIQDSGIELLHDSKDIQTQYLQKYKQWFDLPRDDFEKVITEITSAEKPQERVEKALKWKVANLKLFYSQLFAYLRDNRQFAGEDLIPPSVDGMLRYFRINNYIPGKPFSGQWKEIVETLTTSFGFESALERASCMPLPLPNSVIESIDSMSASEKRVLVKKLLRVSKSPTAVIHTAKLILQLGKDHTTYKRLANAKIRYILSDDFVSEVDAFLRVLQWANYQFSINEDLRYAPGELRLLLAWAHSHHIYSIFTSLGVNSAWVHNTFQQNANAPIRLFEHETNYDNNILNVQNVNARIFITYGVIHLTENHHELVDTSLKEAIVNFVTLNNEGQVLPHPNLIVNPSRAENPLAAFLGRDLSVQLRDFMGEEARLFDYMNWKSLALGTIQNLREHSSNVSTWIELFAVLGILPLDTDVRNELSLSLKSIDYVSLFNENVDFGGKAIHIASIQLLSIQDSDVSSHLRSQIIAISDLLGAKYPAKILNMMSKEERENISRLSGEILEVALNISKMQKSPDERVLEFQKLGTEIAKRWMYFGTTIKPILQFLCEILPPQQTKHLWKLLLFLRANN